MHKNSFLRQTKRALGGQTKWATRRPHMKVFLHTTHCITSCILILGQRCTDEQKRVQPNFQAGNSHAVFNEGPSPPLKERSLDILSRAWGTWKATRWQGVSPIATPSCKDRPDWATTPNPPWKTLLNLQLPNSIRQNITFCLCLLSSCSQQRTLSHQLINRRIHHAKHLCIIICRRQALVQLVYSRHSELLLSPLTRDYVVEIDYWKMVLQALLQLMQDRQAAVMAAKSWVAAIASSILLRWATSLN